MAAVGLSVASKGWFGVVLREDGWETDLFPSVWSVWKRHSAAARVLVDVPVGLPATERRACDVAAKELLGPRKASVFYAPTRAAVYEQNVERARAVNEREAGFSVQNQAWSRVPRIREVDEFLDMNPSARDRLGETHPEVCYHALNGGSPLEHARTADGGVAERAALLREEHPAAGAIYEDSVERYTTPSYAPMVTARVTILDAVAAAVTADRPAEAVTTVPRTAPRDRRGLPMQMTHPTDTRQVRLTALGSGDA